MDHHSALETTDAELRKRRWSYSVHPFIITGKSPISLTCYVYFVICDDFGIWLETRKLVPDENQSATLFIDTPDTSPSFLCLLLFDSYPVTEADAQCI